MAQRYKVTKRLQQQGAVQCFEGTDTLNGLPVYVYQFEGRPLKGSDNLSSNSIPDILSVRSDGNRTQLIATMLANFKTVDTISNPELAEQLLFDTAQALADAAELELRHGDLHEGRIISDGHSFKIEGYGVGWSLDGITYLSPEKNVGIAADSYAWARSMQAILGNTLQQLSPRIRDLLQRCLGDDPETRPVAGDILNELHNLSFDLGGSDSSPPSNATTTGTPSFNFDNLSAANVKADSSPPATTNTNNNVDFDFNAFSPNASSSTSQNQNTNAATSQSNEPKDAYEALFAEDFGIDTPPAPPAQAPTPSPSPTSSDDNPFSSLLLDSNTPTNAGDDDDGFSIDIDDDIQQPITNHTPPPAVIAVAPPMPEEARNESAAEKAQRQKMKTTFVKGLPPGATIKAGKDNSRDGGSAAAREQFFEEEDIAKKRRRLRLPLKRIFSWLLGIIIATGLVAAAVYYLPRLTPPLVTTTQNYTLRARLAAESASQASAAGNSGNATLFVISAPAGSRKNRGDSLGVIGASYGLINFDAAGLWEIQARTTDNVPPLTSNTLRFNVPEAGFPPNSSLSDIDLTP